MFGKQINQIKTLFSYSYYKSFKNKMDNQTPYSRCLNFFQNMIDKSVGWVELNKENVPTLCSVSYKNAPFLHYENIQDDIILFYSNTGSMKTGSDAVILQYFAEHEDCQFLYADEDEEGTNYPWYKPAWSPDTLLSFFYIGSFFAVRKKWLDSVSFPSDSSYESWIYSLVLNLTSDTVPVHLDIVLYSRYKNQYYMTDKAPENPEHFCPGSSEKFIECKNNYLKSKNIKGHIEYDSKNLSVPVYDLPDDAFVSIIIPSKDQIPTVKSCLESIIKYTDDIPYEIIIVDNGSSETNKKEMELLAKELSFQYIYQPMDFNFPKMCNIGFSHSHGNFILLLNNDIEVLSKNWLRILAGQACQPGVGIVGAKLLYPNTDLIQHAGVVCSENGPYHVLQKFDDTETYYYGLNRMVHDLSAVTGACQIMKRSLYEKYHGLEEKLTVAYNDIDFCFRLVKDGFCIIQRNDVTLFHHESLSRGNDLISPEKLERLSKELQILFSKNPAFCKYDSYYSPFLSHANEKIDWDNPQADLCSFAFPIKAITGSSKNVFCALDTPPCFKKHDTEGLSTITISGWSVLAHTPNCRISKHIVLKNKDKYYCVNVIDVLRLDLPSIFPGEAQVYWSGFSCSFLSSSLPAGTYDIIILLHDKKTKKNYMKDFGQSLTILP